MKSMQHWFDEYAESHQHPVNKSIHWICVPIIYCSILAFLAELRIRTGWPVLTPVVGLVMLFYALRSMSIAIGMTLFTFLCLVVIYSIIHIIPFAMWKAALALFIIAWIGQFIGHWIEGKKPSFLKDLQFLLIGPAWLLGHIYRRVGIRY